MQHINPHKSPHSDKPNAKKRKCLYCGEYFLSDWVGHRFCKKHKNVIET